LTFEDYLIDLSRIYSEKYLKDKKLWFDVYLNCFSIRNLWRSIVCVYKKNGLWDQCDGDFSEWANRQKVENKQLLADVLRIIYSLTK
jgi:hypothetical protein